MATLTPSPHTLAVTNLGDVLKGGGLETTNEGQALANILPVCMPNRELRNLAEHQGTIAELRTAPAFCHAMRYIPLYNWAPQRACTSVVFLAFIQPGFHEPQ